MIMRRTNLISRIQDSRDFPLTAHERRVRPDDNPVLLRVLDNLLLLAQWVELKVKTRCKF